MPMHMTMNVRRVVGAGFAMALGMSVSLAATAAPRPCRAGSRCGCAIACCRSSCRWAPPSRIVVMPRGLLGRERWRGGLSRAGGRSADVRERSASIARGRRPVRPAAGTGHVIRAHGPSTAASASSPSSRIHGMKRPLTAARGHAAPDRERLAQRATSVASSPPTASAAPASP